MPLFPLNPIPRGRAVAGGTTHYSTPGVEAGQTGTLAITADVIRYWPIFVDTPIVIDQMALEVTVAGAASTTARMGIYNADTSWQPTTLVVDSGTVAVDSTGVKTATVSVSLAPGRYLLALNTSGAPTLRSARAGTSLFGFLSTIGGSPMIIQGTAALVYAALPADGTAWTSATAGGFGPHQMVFLRISAL